MNRTLLMTLIVLLIVAAAHSDEIPPFMLGDGVIAVEKIGPRYVTTRDDGQKITWYSVGSAWDDRAGQRWERTDRGWRERGTARQWLRTSEGWRAAPSRGDRAPIFVGATHIRVGTNLYGRTRTGIERGH